MTLEVFSKTVKFILFFHIYIDFKFCEQLELLNTLNKKLLFSYWLYLKLPKIIENKRFFSSYNKNSVRLVQILLYILDNL